MGPTVSARDRLIVALDTDAHEARSLARSLEGTVSWLKVGMTLFYESGPEIVDHFQALGFRVFLDLKLHDIPHQVEGAAATLGRLGVGMLTVHAGGGAAMVSAAVRGAERGAQEAGVEAPVVLGVTVLTSMDDATLASVGVGVPAAQQVEALALLAKVGGAGGIVCSPRETVAMRALLADDVYIVTPGVRSLGAEVGDQARIATPAQALAAGASHLVVGRPITSAPVPSAAAEKIIEEMEGTAQWPNS